MSLSTADSRPNASLWSDVCDLSERHACPHLLKAEEVWRIWRARLRSFAKITEVFYLLLKLG